MDWDKLNLRCKNQLNNLREMISLKNKLLNKVYFKEQDKANKIYNIYLKR